MALVGDEDQLVAVILDAPASQERQVAGAVWVSVSSSERGRTIPPGHLSGGSETPRLHSPKSLAQPHPADLAPDASRPFQTHALGGQKFALKEDRRNRAEEAAVTEEPQPQGTNDVNRQGGLKKTKLEGLTFVRTCSSGVHTLAVPQHPRPLLTSCLSQLRAEGVPCGKLTGCQTPRLKPRQVTPSAPKPHAPGLTCGACACSVG